MDRTPNTRSMRLSCKNTIKDNEIGSSSTSTPIAQKSYDFDNEDSPQYLPCTQEEFANVDVVWDWNSPQTKNKPKRAQKRLKLNQSPKLPFKRHPSNNNIKNFDKLREELQALRQEIAVPDNEDCLALSPLDEAEFKYVGNNSNNQSAIASLLDSEEHKNICVDDDLEDLFNDSADEDLCLFSQQIESTLSKNLMIDKNKPASITVIKPVEPTFTSSTFKNSTLKNNHIPQSTNQFDDSLDNIFKNLDDSFGQSKINYNNTLTNKTNNLPRTKSEVQYNSYQSAAKTEFHRTQSFELSNIGNTSTILPKTKMDEIERKRKEALAKLEQKRRQEIVKTNISPMKCSPEEIEKKRKDALARLEAKKQQDIIEKKRQDALKKLEMNRLKNSTMVKNNAKHL